MRKKSSWSSSPRTRAATTSTRPTFPVFTQGDDMDDAMANASEAVALYVEGLREDGEPLDSGVIRRSIPLPA
jgi:HicB-like antitoxin of HicAB toxin-antitoxin system